VAVDLKQLEGKPWYYGAGIGAGLGALLYVVALLYFPNFNEMKNALEGKKGELAQLTEKITQGHAAERRLPQLREEVRRTELDLQRLLQILPTKRNVEELIKKIEGLTRQGDFLLKKFAPKEYVTKDFYAEWPIDISLDGTYHNLALFFDKLARFTRIINVEDLSLTGFAEAPQGHTLGATFTMKTFIYVGDKEEEAKPAAGGKPARAAPAPKKGTGDI
jgi:type IV pilus assembly protein PilO